MSEPFLGQIVMFGGNFAPRGWALCDGQLLAISGNSALFSILGTTYGGDGRTTFALPELRGRVAIHEGTGPGLSPRSLGSKAGAETTTLNVAQLPSHTHPTPASATGVNAVASPADTSNPTGNTLAMANISKAEAPRVSLNAGSVDVAANTTGATGAGQSHTNMQPYQTVNFIIALQGTFPSRN